MTRKRRERLPHHGRGGSRHVGRVRIRLAAILTECLGFDIHPEDLRPAGGRQRNRTTEFDGYAWEVVTSTGVPFIAGSFDTMTNCVKAGAVELHKGEIVANLKSNKLVDILGKTNEH